jgi:hypothetical protein
MPKKIAAFLFFAIFCASLFGVELDRTQIAIQAKIYPQLIFFSAKTKELNPQKPIVIIAVYSDATKRFAEVFKEECEKIHKNGIKGFMISVRLVHRDKVSSQKDFAASYLFFEDDDELKVYSLPDMRGALTFAGTKRIFEKNGVLFFVEITNKTSILLNKKALNASGLSFDSSLLKLVKVYDE